MHNNIRVFLPSLFLLDSGQEPKLLCKQMVLARGAIFSKTPLRGLPQLIESTRVELDDSRVQKSDVFGSPAVRLRRRVELSRNVGRSAKGVLIRWFFPVFPKKH